MRYTARATRTAALVAGIILIGLATPICRADLIPIQFGQPVIQGINGTLAYDLSTGNLHYDAEAITYASDAVPGGFVFFSSGQVTMDLFVDTNGNFVSSGTGLRVIGALDLDSDGIDDVSGSPANPLLFGSVLAFGAEPPGPPTRALDALWQIDGGELTTTFALSGGGSMFGGFTVGGYPGGVYASIENAVSGTVNEYTVSWSSTNIKTITGNTTPEPSTLGLSLLGGLAVAGVGWLKRRRTRGESV